jgi:translation initiation factor RLI1
MFNYSDKTNYSNIVTTNIKLNKDDLQKVYNKLVDWEKRLIEKEKLLQRMDENVKKQFTELFNKQDEIKNGYNKWLELKPLVENVQSKLNPIIKNDLPKSGILHETHDDPDDYETIDEDIVSSFDESVNILGKFD